MDVSDLFPVMTIEIQIYHFGSGDDGSCKAFRRQQNSYLRMGKSDIEVRASKNDVDWLKWCFVCGRVVSNNKPYPCIAKYPVCRNKSDLRRIIIARIPLTSE